MSFLMEHVREADVPPEAVFAAYVDPSTWGAWGHNTRWARLAGPFEVGAVVDVCAGYRRVWPVRVLKVDTGRTVVCEVRPPGVTIISTFDVDPAPSGARLRHAIEVSGWLELGYRPLQPLYTKLLAKETQRLVEFIRAQPAGAPGS